MRRIRQHPVFACRQLTATVLYHHDGPRRRQGGASLENVGFFNPVAGGNELKLKLDLPRIEYWVGQGAQPSERVRSLLSSYRKQATA